MTRAATVAGDSRFDHITHRHASGIPDAIRGRVTPALARLNGRHITGVPSFTDDFNENAKVAVDIHVDGAGNVIDATYQPRGSTTSESSMKAIALRKARQVKFNSGGDESVGTIIFNFKIHN